MIKNITVKEVEYAADRLARELSLINASFAGNPVRPAGILESCVSEAFQVVDNRFKYPDLLSRASLFFYLMIKKRPFDSGNKEIAVAILLAFLFANDKWLMVEPDMLGKFSNWIAESLPEFRNEVISAIEKLLRNHTVNLLG